jgi:hypothetical protein
MWHRVVLVWYLQISAHAGFSLKDFSTLKMEVIRFSETLVHTSTTPRHISEDCIIFFYSHFAVYEYKDTSHLHGWESFLKSLYSFNYSRNFQAFMEPQDTLLCLRQLATGLCPKLTNAVHTRVPCNFKVYLNITFASPLGCLKWSRPLRTSVLCTQRSAASEMKPGT